MISMLKYILTPILFFLCLTTYGISILQNYLNQPESVVYDQMRNRYLVSNKGNGNIIELNNNGNQSIFKTDLISSRGLVIVNNTLFVACDLGVVGIDLESAETRMIIPIPGMQFLNDICADWSGNLYVSDSDASKIVKVEISSQKVSTLINNGISGCNGLVYKEQSNSILVCLWSYPGMIKEIDLTTLEIETVAQTYLDGCDGLAIDGSGYIYVSSFISGSVYRYDPQFLLPREIVSADHKGPADIYYNVPDNVVMVPNFDDNSVEFIPVIPVAIPVDLDPSSGQKDIALRNYPNPFSSKTTISFYLPEDKIISLDLVDHSGRPVSKLIEHRLHAKGTHRLHLSAKSLNPGVYWLFLTTNQGERKSLKIVIY